MMEGGMIGRTWNYRVVDHGDYVALHEVHYEHGVPVARTSEPCVFMADSDEGAAGIIASLELALEGARKELLLDPWPAATRTDG
jgi:hypothetical protein